MSFHFLSASWWWHSRVQWHLRRLVGTSSAASWANHSFLWIMKTQQWYSQDECEAFDPQMDRNKSSGPGLCPSEDQTTRIRPVHINIALVHGSDHAWFMTLMCWLGLASSFYWDVKISQFTFTSQSQFKLMREIIDARVTLVTCEKMSHTARRHKASEFELTLKWNHYLCAVVL